MYSVNYNGSVLSHFTRREWHTATTNNRIDLAIRGVATLRALMIAAMLYYGQERLVLPVCCALGHK